MPGIQENENLDEELEEEEQYAAELAFEQEIYESEQQLNKLREEGQSYRRPSWLKYGFLFSLAAVVDIVDLSDLTGVGVILGRAVSFLFSVIIVLILWFTDTKQKVADEYVNNLERTLDFVANKLAGAQAATYKTTRIAGRATGITRRQSLKKAALRAGARVRRFGRTSKNPIVRYLFMGAGNLIPFLALIPFQILGIYLSYRAEKSSYDNAKEAAENINLEELSEPAA